MSLALTAVGCLRWLLAGGRLPSGRWSTCQGRARMRSRVKRSRRPMKPNVVLVGVECQVASERCCDDGRALPVATDGWHKCRQGGVDVRAMVQVSSWTRGARWECFQVSPRAALAVSLQVAPLAFTNVPFTLRAALRCLSGVAYIAVEWRGRH